MLFIIKALKNFINLLNNYSSLLLVILAIISLIYAYKEFILKRRPFVTVELVNEIKDDKWFFYVILVNKGAYPGIAKIEKTLLKIGDEEYPTIFHSEIVLSPSEKIKIAPIGHINELGRRKIKGQEYKTNRVEIVLEVKSKSVGDKKFKYKTITEYNVDVSGDNPAFTIISEKLD